MILILSSEATDEQIDYVLKRVDEIGLQAHLSRGSFRTIVGIIGDEDKIRAEPLSAIPGVQEVIPVLPPYKLASLEAHPEPSEIQIGSTTIGGGHLAIIAGPCAVESPERMDSIAKAVKSSGATIFRGGAFKPRTSPYSFQGMGLDGLKLLKEVGQRYDMPVVTEVMDPRLVEPICEHADMLQIGARNMQNFVLLTEVGKANKPVLLKRGMSATVNDLLMSAEYILSQGNPDVVLCERGVRGFDSATRNLYDVASVALVKQLSHLPIIVDPSHATGVPDLIPPCALAGVAVGADGVHVEVHDKPEEAKSDGQQALLPERFAELMDQIRRMASVFDLKLSSSEMTTN